MQNLPTKQYSKFSARQQPDDLISMSEGLELSQSYTETDDSVVEPMNGSEITATPGKPESKLPPGSVHGVFAPASSIERDSATNLLALPVEIFPKVILRLWPGDLLALARTCKSLRQILMSKSSADMWIKVEMMTPRLPRHPTSMNPPQYAALIYTKDCSLCGGSANVKLEDTLRVRLCESCNETELVDVYSIEDHVKQQLIDHLSLITKVPKVPSKYPWNGRIEPGRRTPHCLRRDLQTLQQARADFASRGDKYGLANWNWEQCRLVESNDEFAQKMRAYFIFLQLTLKQQALLENGEDLASLDKLFDYRQYNEFGFEYGDEMFDKEGNEVIRRLDEELPKLKDQVSLFLPVLSALGQRTTATFSNFYGETEISWPILDCPLPTLEILWRHRGYESVDRDESRLVMELIRANPDRFLKFIEEWREEGERQLVKWWLETKVPDDFKATEVSHCIVKVRTSYWLHSVMGFGFCAKSLLNCDNYSTAAEQTFGAVLKVEETSA